MKNKRLTVGVALLAIVMLTASISSFIMRKPTPITVNKNITTEKIAQSESEEEPFDYKRLSLLLTASRGVEFREEILEGANISRDNLETLMEKSENGELDNLEFYKLTGYTVNAFIDKFDTSESRDMGSNGKSSFILGFTGDINFDETSYYVMIHALTKPNVVLDCIDEAYRNEMVNADIMLVNNEFPYTDRGAPTPDKKYTFHAKPEYVKYMTEMGVDIVSLANNHTYDYGIDSFTDTLDTLKNADIEYVGAGMNIEEAMQVKSFIINGYKVGYIACSGVESPIKTPVATETTPGICGSYYEGANKVAAAITKAKESCDYVIVFPHWGYENTTSLSSGQKENSRLWIDAGADAVIGAHSHCLQGMDYYKGKFIAYSLGNFWFNGRNVYTALLKLEISEKGISPIIVPGKQYNKETTVITESEEQRKVYNLIEGYETINGVSIDDNGVVSPK